MCRKRAKAALISVVCVYFILAGEIAVAEKAKLAEQAMRKGNFAEAYCLWKPLAESGDAEAQYNIGWMYRNGYGLLLDDESALQWWGKAAEQNHNEANFSIAMLYSLGEGKIKRDKEKALDNYLVAAKNGHEDARLILRAMIERDDKVISKRLPDLFREHYELFESVLRIKVPKANIRSGPSTDTSILHVLVKDDVVVEMKRKGRWIYAGIVSEGYMAWLHDSLVDVYIETDDVASEVTAQEITVPEQAVPGDVVPAVDVTEKAVTDEDVAEEIVTDQL